MGVRFEHPGFGLVFRLDEHGGDAEERDELLYHEWCTRVREAVWKIAAEPAYAEIALNEDTYRPIARESSEGH